MSHGSRAFFDQAYRDAAPWDIGVPQPALMALIEEFPTAGPVLDAGCGTGDLSIALAGHGLAVVGVDLVAAAIAKAREKAAAAPDIAGRVEFREGDALYPSTLSGSFAAVVDSGFLHLFGQADRDTLERELAATLPVGGRYYLLGFAMDFPHPNAPKAVREEEVRERFRAGRGWKILALRQAQFVTRLTPMPAIVACIERVDEDRAG